MKKWTWAEIVAISSNCQICEKEIKEDVPHLSGRVLALDATGENSITHYWFGVCGNCNRALTYAKDSPGLLRKMANYLESENQPT